MRRRRSRLREDGIFYAVAQTRLKDKIFLWKGDKIQMTKKKRAANRPNFFIVGAPKCGTTSLYDWLQQHPNVFMAPVKEPHYFNFDRRGGISDVDDYHKLFEGACENQTAIGEASTHYFSSDVAIREIIKYNPLSKLIVCLRNPAEMAVSLFYEKVFLGEEPLKNFEDAWYQNDQKMQGCGRTLLTFAPENIAYKNECRLGSHLIKALSIVNSPQLMVVFLDDIANFPQRTFWELEDFLEIPHVTEVDFTQRNMAKEAKSIIFQRFIRYTLELKRKLGLRISLDIAPRLISWNTHTRKNKKPSEKMLSTLKAEFLSEIEIIENLTGRDLGHWK